MTDKEKLEKIEEFIKNKKKECKEIVNKVEEYSNDALFNEGAYSAFNWLEDYIYSLDHPVLKECPFCGGKAELNTELDGSKPSEYIIYCTDCRASSRYYKSWEEAVDNWNRRK